MTRGTANNVARTLSKSFFLHFWDQKQPALKSDLEPEVH